VQKRYDWAEIQRFYDDRHTLAETSARFGFNLSSWTKAIKRGAIKSRKRGYLPRPELYAHLRYDWAEVQRYYDRGHSRAEAMQRFGFCAASWTDAVKRGALVARPRGVTPEDVCRDLRSRHAVKRRLLEAGILQNRCDDCGLTEWRGRPISIQIDHRNGIRDDHRLENLRMLCPNCHSQTETYGARNKKRLATLSIKCIPGW
jgi:hypothetical protein